MDKVDNRTIECMVCASCTFKGEKRQEERKIDRSEGEAGGRSQGDVEEEKIELSKNCQNGFRKNSRDAAQMDDARGTSSELNGSCHTFRPGALS